MRSISPTGKSRCEMALLGIPDVREKRATDLFEIGLEVEKNALKESDVLRVASNELPTTVIYTSAEQPEAGDPPHSTDRISSIQ